MKPEHLYLALCVLGTILPYSQLVPFLREHGPDLRLFVEQMSASRVGGFFVMDVIVSSVVAPIVANLVVGVSLGLPLFLYMRERQPEAARP